MIDSRLIAVTLTLLALGAGPVRSAESLELDGLFEERAPVVLTFQPLSNVGPVTVAEAVPPGPVNEGDVLVRLEAPELDRRIREQELALSLQRIRLERQREQVRLVDETQALKLLEAERALARAEHAHETLRYVSMPQQLFNRERQVRDWDTVRAEAEEQFRLVVEMYEADDTVETTERMDMDMRRRSLDRRELSRPWAMARFEIFRDQTIPAQLADSELSVRRARHARDLARSTSEHRARLSRLGLEKGELELRLEERKLERLRRDREALTVTAPAHGFAVAGHYDGRWTSKGDLGASMKHESRVSPGQVLYSIVQPAPKRIRVTVPEASLLEVRIGQSATWSATASPNAWLPAEVTEIDPVVRGGRFTVWLTARVRHERLLPGSTCRVRFAID